MTTPCLFCRKGLFAYVFIVEAKKGRYSPPNCRKGVFLSLTSYGIGQLLLAYMLERVALIVVAVRSSYSPPTCRKGLLLIFLLVCCIVHLIPADLQEIVVLTVQVSVNY